MKKYFVFLFLSIVTTGVLLAQSRLRESDLEGTTWKMVFDIEHEAKEDAHTAFERIVLSAVGGLMDEIHVYFEFLEDNRMIVWVDAFGVEDEEEDSEWYVNKRGQLIMGDSDSFSSDDTIWMRDGSRISAYKMKRGRLKRSDEIYLKRVRQR